MGGLLCRRGWGSAARPGGGSTLTFRSFPLLLAGAFATSHFFLRCRRPHLAERCPHRWHQGQRPKSAQHAAHSLTTVPRWRKRRKFTAGDSANSYGFALRPVEGRGLAATTPKRHNNTRKGAPRRQREDRRGKSSKVCERHALGDFSRCNRPVVRRNQTGILATCSPCCPK